MASRAASFEWDEAKNRMNLEKHGATYGEAQLAFFDLKRVIAKDVSHSVGENRYFCFGKVGRAVMTVRFTYRRGRIRIFGAGYWRKGRKVYEQANP